MTALSPAAALLLSATACCGTAPVAVQKPTPLIGPETVPSVPHLHIVAPPGRPRMAVLVREGDPAPALAAAIVTDLGSGPTVALSAVVESRMLAAGLNVQTRVDRGAFRVRLAGGADQPSAKAFFAALSAAFAAPITQAMPEIAKASDRILALKRHPLPAAQAEPIAACTGQLGLVPGERVLDPLTPAGLAELEAARVQALTLEHTAIAAVGPAAFCADAERELAQSTSFPTGAPVVDAWPKSDTTAAFAEIDVAPGQARVTVAVRLGDPLATVSAASTLAEPYGALRSRLRALPSPFRVTEVVGVARPQGGCISVTAETAETPPGGRNALPDNGALVAAIVRKTIAKEASAQAAADTATRAVLTAGDPRDAAERAAWWALSAPAKDAIPKWATTLSLTPNDRDDLPAITKRFEAALAAANLAANASIVERRSAIEQGQGEVWVLLASPCGAADEGAYDAGTSALAAMAASSEVSRNTGIPMEPWITPDGVGILAHAAAIGSEDPQALGRRVAAAAARAFSGELPTKEAVTGARASVLTQIERTTGPRGAALDALLGSLAPEHPSQLFALGTFSRVAALATQNVAGRWQNLANGPLRMAVLANGGAVQANEAFAAADHWLSPRAIASEYSPHSNQPPPQACTDVSAATLTPGQYDVLLPKETELSQALLAVNVATRDQPGRKLAEIALRLLDGERGLVQQALDHLSIPARATARLLGGNKSAALAIEVRAPQPALQDAVNEVKALLKRLGHDGPTETAVAQAETERAKAAREADLEPRNRVIKLWLGPPLLSEPAPTQAALKAFFATSFRESALVLVMAQSKQ